MNDLSKEDLLRWLEVQGIDVVVSPAPFIVRGKVRGCSSLHRLDGVLKSTPKFFLTIGIRKSKKKQEDWQSIEFICVPERLAYSVMQDESSLDEYTRNFIFRLKQFLISKGYETYSNKDYAYRISLINPHLTYKDIQNLIIDIMTEFDL